MLNISSRGIALIRKYENCRLSLYKDLNGFFTIGWGHKVKPSEMEKFRMGIIQEEADCLLDEDLNVAERCVNSVNEKHPLTQGQFDALTSFTYNLGVSRLNELMAHGIDQVPLQLPRWVYAGSEQQKGLIKRRAEEVEFWNS